MDYINIIIVAIMIIGSVAAAMIRNLLSAVIIFMVYSLMMAVLWQRMNAPDLAITEAAVGAGITTILFVIALNRMKVAKK
ncbi:MULTISPECIES: hydrogenase subunit MbhD domain-containing protein [unclassified Fusibacter]|uniref:hydrogenase subunit MbhD domain-containing protein n=1 Tax=unclassified Fusibacter TaxID=2624464 RepID=UPI0010132C6C|nr:MULTISPECIES: hydrogenase subunit MbhD domain-containing protein [unclassified Fusibacter]MCK8061083.1 DUF4040 domain-containing protein [Fusibacter sp. A2]NPE23381.1 DUF4040 domain-containing protein [Fusibacter sp. A1]RXV59426.1 DUF4040 domain-containing protein [Fusibacter sp. A1]